MQPMSGLGGRPPVDPRPASGEPPGLYQRIVSHERSMWIATIAVVATSAATLAIVTVTVSGYGIFDGPYRGYLLAGSIFLLLGIFLARMAWQRRSLEGSRARLFRELESRSAELAEANRALNDALQTRDVFLKTVSHELRTPLTCVIAYSEFLAEETPDREQVREHACAVLREAKSLQRLIEQLFEVTRIRSGQLRLDRAGVDLGDLVRNAAERHREEAESRGLGFRLNLSRDALPAWVDVRRMEDALATVLHNAIRHSEAPARIDVRTRRLDEGWGEILVHDETGRSLRAEREALDHPFAGLDPEPHGRAGDLGLGLPLVKRFVMAHGGAVLVSESRRRRGLVYRIQLPIQSAATRSRPPDIPPANVFPLDRAS